MEKDDISRLYLDGCPHDSNGRHNFQPRFTIEKSPIEGTVFRKIVKKYECDVCTVCGLTTGQIFKNGEKIKATPPAMHVVPGHMPNGGIIFADDKEQNSDPLLCPKIGKRYLCKHRPTTARVTGLETVVHYTTYDGEFSTPLNKFLEQFDI